MRPFALTMVSALIFSPSIVLSTIYHPEHQIHTTHNSDPSLTSISVEIVVPLKSSAKFNECKYTPYKCSAVDTDKYGLECQNNFIDNSQIRQSAKTACHQISEHHGHGLSNYIPRTAYQRQGPYFEYSVEDDSKKWGGYHKTPQIVITDKCEVVGGVFHENNGKVKNCHFRSQ